MDERSRCAVYSAGCGFLYLPAGDNYLAEKNKSLVRTAYTKTVEELDDSNIQTMLKDTQEYNAALAPGTISRKRDVL